MKNLEQWMEFAERFSKGDFWNGLFEQGGQPGAVAGSGQPWSPPVDVFRVNQETWVVAELPGVKRENLELAVAGDTLTIKGMKPDRRSSGQPFTTERYSGPFERSVRLPHQANAEQVSARLEEGLLIVRFPAAPPKEAKISLD